MVESYIFVEQPLDMLRSRREAAKIFEAKPGTTFGYPKALGFMWDIAIEELHEKTLKIIRVLSMLNSVCIPEEIFHGHHSEQNVMFLNGLPRTRYVI